MNLSTINLPKKSGVEILFNKTYTRVSGFTMNNQDIIENNNKLSFQVLNEYKIRGHFISIYRTNEGSFYSAKSIYNFEEKPLLFAELSAIIFKNKARLGNEILKFEELVDTLKSICMWKILEMTEISINPEIFSEIFIYKLIKLDKLIPLFLDDNVNEIYMDERGSPIYIDHQLFGRCNTNIILTEEELNALVTRIKLEHPISITIKNPSLKVEFQTSLFHMRISMDFPPLSPNGPSFNIRKLKARPLELGDLVLLDTLPSYLASYLVEVIKARMNITVIGEPNSGKTTLANAIDLYTPKYWRKIAIEDAIESIKQSSLGYKQLSIQVDSFESNKSDYTKTSEILKLLHRSPDWIYLGEIQSCEHTQAMFEALNAGLKGIQTAHSDSIQKLFRRWKNLHNISETDFLSLEVIIVMKRDIKLDGIIRKVSKVYEIGENEEHLFTKIYDLQWDKNQFFEKITNQSKLKQKMDIIIQGTAVFSSQTQVRTAKKDVNIGEEAEIVN